jgi:LEA14-like dessication related protein
MRKKTVSSQTWLLIAAAGGLAWYFFSRAQTLSNLIFVPRGIGTVAGGVSVRLGVQNPTANPIQLNSLAGSLVINGNAVGNVSSFLPVTIAPNAETVLDLTIIPNMFGAASQVLNLIEGNEFNTKLNPSLQGTANVNNIAVPLNISLT